MGIAERKEREKQRRRDEILDAAEKVFFNKGVQLATMDDVAEAAELSKGTLYLYFKSKEELYLALHLRGLAIMDQMFMKASDKHEKGLDKVMAIGEAYYQFYRDYPDYFNVLMYYEGKEIPANNGDSVAMKCMHMGHRSLDLVIKALEVGVKDGSIRADLDPEKTATILWGQATGVIQLLVTKGEHLCHDHNIDIDNLVEYSFHLMVKGLAGK